MMRGWFKNGFGGEQNTTKQNMTPTEKLERIKAKCEQLLAIAEKRTNGKWHHDSGERCSHWVSSHLSTVCVIPTDSIYCAADTSQNASFIAACAGPAEAGWRATIAVIDWINSDHGIPDLYSQDCVDEAVTRLTKSILAAWPEELL